MVRVRNRMEYFRLSRFWFFGGGRCVKRINIYFGLRNGCVRVCCVR